MVCKPTYLFICRNSGIVFLCIPQDTDTYLLNITTIIFGVFFFFFFRIHTSNIYKHLISFLQIRVLRMVCSMNLRNMERSHLYKSTELQRSATGLSFSASKRTKRKHLEHQRGSFFLACKLMSQPGMALVSSDL